MKTEKIRAFLLEVGDRFIMNDMPYKIIKENADDFGFVPLSGLSINELQGVKDESVRYIGKESKEIILLIDEGRNKIFLEGTLPETEDLAGKESEKICLPDITQQCQKTE